jgi:Kef-type K+ transport system membrane component KefB
VEIITEILVLLLLARIMGEGAERMGLPTTVGELVAGILLAALVGLVGADIPIIQHIATSEALGHIASAGIFFLVLLAGIELKPEEIVQHSLRSLGVAMGGAILPLIMGFAAASAFLPESELKQGQAMLVGIAMAVTALPDRSGCWVISACFGRVWARQSLRRRFSTTSSACFCLQC